MAEPAGLTHSGLRRQKLLHHRMLHAQTVTKYSFVMFPYRYVNKKTLKATALVFLLLACSYSGREVKLGSKVYYRVVRFANLSKVASLYRKTTQKTIFLLTLVEKNTICWTRYKLIIFCFVYTLLFCTNCFPW